MTFAARSLSGLPQSVRQVLGNERKLALWLLAIAAACALVFLAALHPATGFFGGLVYFLTASALPTIMVLALAVGFACLIPAPLAVQIGAAAVLSIVFGLNTSLPVIIDLVKYDPVTSFDVRKPALWSDGQPPVVNVKKQRWGPIFVVPFGPRVRVAGDEGCGCMYFLDAAYALYSDRAIAVLFSAVGRRGGVTDYSGSAAEQTDVHIDLSVWREEDGYRFLIELFDHGEKTAAFAQRRIPFRAFTDPTGLSWHRLGDNFFENASDILLHDNVFSRLANALAPEYFAERELRVFFLRAIGKA